MPVSNEYSATVIDRSGGRGPEVNKSFTSDNEPPASLLTHSMFNLDTPLYPITPDLPDRCPHCGFHIRMSLKYDHALFHRALSTLGYSGSDWPTEVSETLERRQKLVQQYMDRLRKARKAAAEGSKRSKFKGEFIELVNDINIAFSLVKLYVEDEYEIGQKPHSKVSISGKTNVSVPADGRDKCVLLAALLNEQNNRWQTEMTNHSVFVDDVMTCQMYDVEKEEETSLDIDHRVQFVGLYSGYRGEASSHRCYLKLHEILSAEMSKLYSTTATEQTKPKLDSAYFKQTRSNMTKVDNHPYCEQVKQSLKTTFEETDNLICMGEDEFGNVRWSGCSVSVAIFENIDDVTVLHIANCGDNRIVACRNGEAVRLSKVHNLNSPAERQRIKENQECYEHLKKFKETQASRGLGNYGDKLLRQCVVPVPSCVSYVIDDDIEFILLGSRGLFGVLSEAQCIRICKSVLPKYFFEVKQSVEEQILSDIEQDETARNKTVTFRSASQLQEVHVPISRSEMEMIEDEQNADINETEELNQQIAEENVKEGTPESNLDHPMGEPKEGSPELKHIVEESSKTGSPEALPDPEASSASKTTGPQTVNEARKEPPSNDSSPDSLNAPAVPDDGDSDEGSTIVSGVDTPSSEREKEERDGSNNSVKKQSECEVFKGVPIKELKEELSSVKLDSATNEWRNYLPSMAKNICEKLCLSAMKNGCKENVSCAIIFLPGIKKQLNISE